MRIIFALDPSPDDTEAVILREASAIPQSNDPVFTPLGQPAATMAAF